MTVAADFSRIKTKLQMTGLQQKDNRLYQVIHDLITAVEQQQKFGDQELASAVTDVNKVTNIQTTMMNEDIINEEYYQIAGAATGAIPIANGYITNEVPSGAINSSNTVFTTAQGYVAGTLDVYLNGVRQKITTDYTETAVNQFTFVVAPTTGDTVLVDYGTPTSQGPAGPIGPTGQGTVIYPQDGQDGDMILVPGRDGVVDSTAASVYRNVAQTITKNVETAITWDSVLFDTNAFWSAGSPTRLTIPSGKDGKYIIFGQITYVLGGSSHIDLHVYKNGSRIADVTFDETNSDASSQVMAIANLIAGDYIELKTLIDSGPASVDTVGGADRTAFALALCTGTGSNSFIAGSGITISGNTISVVPAVGKVLLYTLTQSSLAASVDIVTRNAGAFTGAIFQSDYDEYIIEVINLIPETDNTDLSFRVSVDGGGTFEASNYARALRVDNQAFNSVLGADSGLTSVILAPNVDNTTTQASLNGTINIFNPLSAALYKPIIYRGTYKNNDGHYYSEVGSGWWLGTTAVNAVRFIMSSGKISGIFRVYGLRKS